MVISFAQACAFATILIESCHVSYSIRLFADYLAVTYCFYYVLKICLKFRLYGQTRQFLRSESEKSGQIHNFIHRKRG